MNATARWCFTYIALSIPLQGTRTIEVHGLKPGFESPPRAHRLHTAFSVEALA
jgi:hypothetical protein